MLELMNARQAANEREIECTPHLQSLILYPVSATGLNNRCETVADIVIGRFNGVLTNDVACQIFVLVSSLHNLHLHLDQVGIVFNRLHEMRDHFTDAESWEIRTTVVLIEREGESAE